MANHGQFHILLIEDNATAAKLAQIWLKDGLRSPFVLRTAQRLSDGLAILEQDQVHLVILDLNLPDSSGLDTFRSVFDHAHDAPIVVLSSDADEEVAVEAVRLGAQDYVVKGNDGRNPLARPVRFALERVHRQRAEEALRENERSLFVARSVQQNLFPDAPPPLAGIGIGCRCDPAEMVGGDYYDFIALPDKSLGLVIADVSGHGMAAALIMVEIRAVLRSLARSYGDIGRILTVASEIVTPDLDELFVALFFAAINPVTRTLRYVGAGHPGLVLDAAGNVRPLRTQTPPLGVHEGEFVTSREVVLQDGEILVLYTDGLTETFNDTHEVFGLPRMLDVIRAERTRPAAEIVERVFQATRDFAGEVAQVDDNTMLLVKMAAVEPS